MVAGRCRPRARRRATGSVLGDADAIRPDPRSRRQPRGVHGHRPLRHASRVDGCRMDRAAACGRADLRIAHRHFHARRHVRRRHRHVRPPRRARGHARRAAAGQRLQRRAQLGLRRCALVCRARGVRRPRRLSAGSWMPRTPAGSPSSRTWSTTTSGRAATTSPSSARICATRESNTWGSSVDLDQRAVRDHIVGNALMWLRDYHVDGLRLDAVHALGDRRTRTSCRSWPRRPTP